MFCFLVSGWINLDRVRIPGVLQRFAISYLVVAGTAAIVARLTAKEDQEPSHPVIKRDKKWSMSIYLVKK